MKTKFTFAFIMLGFLMAFSVEALPNIPPPNIGPTTKAPEISVASGASAIALLTGILLLVGERSRTRRS
jgi:hypothetical protein